MTVLLVLMMFAIFLTIDFFYSKAKHPALQVAPAKTKKAGTAPRLTPSMVGGFSVPDNLRYHPGHTWALSESPNLVRIGIDEMANVNGSAPDLAHVTRWFIASQSDKPVAAYFGAITLEGGEADAAPAAPAVGPAANTAYRIQGTIGDLKVDLLITPVPLNTIALMCSRCRAHPSSTATPRSRLASSLASSWAGRAWSVTGSTRSAPSP